MVQCVAKESLILTKSKNKKKKVNDDLCCVHLRNIPQVPEKDFNNQCHRLC